MQRSDRSARTKRITVCALLAALGVVLLYFGSLVEIFDVSMAVIVSLFCVFTVIEYGGSAPWLLYGVTSVLALILLPVKTAGILYLLFFGYYPILKSKLEQCSPRTAWLLKEIIFQIAFAVILLLARFFLTTQENEPMLLWIVLIVLGEIIFPLYDLALTRLITLYLTKLRKLLHIR